MRTILVSLLIFLISFFNTPLAWATEPITTLRVGVYTNEPKVFINEDGDADGVFPNILDFIAEKEDWQIEYVHGLWEEGLSRLENGQIDIMVDVAFSEERLEKFDFPSEAVLDSWATLYVNKDSSISSFPDLQNKKISILKSSVYGSGLDGMETILSSFGLSAELVEVDSYAGVFDLLEYEDVDAALVSKIYGIANKKYYPNIKSSNIIFHPTELRFALSKGKTNNQHIMERLDFWTAIMKEDDGGIYDQILDKHGLSQYSKEETTKEEITNETDNEQGQSLSLWILPFSLGLVAGILLLRLAALCAKLRRKLLKRDK